MPQHARDELSTFHNAVETLSTSHTDAATLLAFSMQLPQPYSYKATVNTAVISNAKCKHQSLSTAVIL